MGSAAFEINTTHTFTRTGGGALVTEKTQPLKIFQTPEIRSHIDESLMLVDLQELS